MHGQPEPGSRWQAVDASHRGVIVRVERVTALTVCFKVLVGSRSRRYRLFSVPTEQFLQRYEPQGEVEPQPWPTAGYRRRAG